jgi:hypothetical protein
MSSSEDDALGCSVCLWDVTRSEADTAIYQCPAGHLLCFTCYRSLGGAEALCPTCQRQLGDDFRNRPLEAIRNRKKAAWQHREAASFLVGGREAHAVAVADVSAADVKQLVFARFGFSH